MQSFKIRIKGANLQQENTQNTQFLYLYLRKRETKYLPKYLSIQVGTLRDKQL